MTELSTRRVALLGLALVLLGAMGFYNLPGMIDEEASGSRIVNSIYCSVMTLTTVGYGDICPSDKLTHSGRAFLVFYPFVGVGMFCGPVMNVATKWKTQVPGGLVALTSLTIALGVVIFSQIEEMNELEAAYASVVTGTTIGYGDATPKTDMGRMAVAMYAVVAVNVVAAILEPAKLYLENFCKAPEKVATE